MKFILKFESLDKLKELREDYQQAKKLDLKEPPSLLGWPTLFGGTDVENRNKQISFLEEINKVITELLLKKDMNTTDLWQANLNRARILIVATLFIQAQISKPKENSLLYRLLNDMLGITKDNFLDEEDKETCFSAAHQWISQINSISFLREELIPFRFLRKDPLWNEFDEFLSARMKQYSVPSKTSYQRPVSTVIPPVLETLGYYAGAGFSGPATTRLNGSTFSMRRKLQLTDLVGRTLVSTGAIGPWGAMVVAPVVAMEFFDVFCNTSLRHLLGKTLGVIGYGAGAMIALPLDFIYNLMPSRSSLFAGLLSQTPHTEQLNGTRISDGQFIINGQPVSCQLIDSTDYSHTIRITEESNVLLITSRDDAAVSSFAEKLQEKLRTSPLIEDITDEKEENEEEKIIVVAP